MTRVAVLGNAGGGKSTLCRALGTAKSLPVYQVDKIQWNPGWIATPPEQFDEAHDHILVREKWIIDGVASLESIERRLIAADTIIFIDLPLFVYYWWSFKRQFMCLFRERPHFVEGCPMIPKTFELAKMIWSVHKHMKPEILKLIRANAESTHVYHIQSPSELEEFRREQCAI